MGATGINWQVTRHVRAVGRIREAIPVVGPVADGGVGGVEPLHSKSQR